MNNLYKEMNEGDFYTRIREESSKNGKVYYLGVKPFSIGSKFLITNLNKSMFIFNSFNINEKNKIKLREFRDYFYGEDNFKLNYIKLNKASNYDDDAINALEKISKITNTKPIIKNDEIEFKFKEIDIDGEYNIFKIIYIDYKNYFKECEYKYSNSK